MDNKNYLIKTLQGILCSKHSSYYIKSHIEDGLIVVQCNYENCNYKQVISEDDYIYLNAIRKVSALIVRKWENYYGKNR